MKRRFIIRNTETPAQARACLDALERYYDEDYEAYHEGQFGYASSVLYSGDHGSCVCYRTKKSWVAYYQPNQN